MKVILVVLFMLYLVHPPPNKPLPIEHHNVGLLSAIINAEAIPNNMHDGYLVGSTVLNRAEHNTFPQTIKEVIYQPNQYYGIRSSKFKRSVFSDTVAVRLLRGVGRNCEVLYFYNPAGSIKFRQKMNKHKLITRSRAHKFFGHES